MSRNNKKERCKDSNKSKEPTMKLKDEFEEKFAKALNDITEKSAETRCLALQTICDVLVHRYIPALVEEHCSILKHATEKSILHGKGAEQIWAVKLAPLLVLQLGDAYPQMNRDLNRCMFTTVQDESVLMNVRAKCCNSLGLLNFLARRELDQISPVMEFLEDVSGLRKNSRSCISINSDTANMHSAALTSWALLFTAMSSSYRATSKNRLPLVEQLLEMLRSPHLEIRVAAGETLCLIWECGRSQNATFLSETLEDVIDSVQQLATDSTKHRGKRDLKSQRASFRDILKYLQHGTGPEINVRFGIESLVLDSWRRYIQYASLCTLIGPGITYQLEKNSLIREIFQLGRKVNVNQVLKATKQAKLHPEVLEAAVPRQRSFPRNVDKRCSGEQSYRNGKGAVLLWSAKLSALLDDSEAMNKILYHNLSSTMWTWNVSNKVRAKCCIALGLLHLTGNNDNAKKQMISSMEDLCQGSYIPGYHQAPEMSTLYSAALFTWAFVIVALPEEDFVYNMTSRRRRGIPLAQFLVKELKSFYLEVRMTAAEAVALIMEHGRSYDTNFLSEYVDDFVMAVRQLEAELPDSATWYDDKRDAEYRRTILRKVVKFLQDNSPPEISVSVGSEVLVLDSWSTYFNQMALCVEIGPDMTSFLLEKNLIPVDFIQKIVNSPQAAAKQEKAEVNLLKAATFKLRTVRRGEDRNKRTAIHS